MTLRTLRLRAIWLLIVPFLWYARPTPTLLAVGIALAALGLWIRARAAGFIHKDRELTTTGPYAHTRNPLYLGTFFLGLGVTVAGGRELFVVLFMIFFVWIYSRTMQAEAELLTELFGDAYRDYARRVPLLIPRLKPYQAVPQGAQAAEPFSFERWRRNREYEALLGAVAGFAFLTLRMWMS